MLPGQGRGVAAGLRDPPLAALRAATSSGGCVRGGGRGAAPRPGWRRRKMAAGIREKQTGERLPAVPVARRGSCRSRGSGWGGSTLSSTVLSEAFSCLALFPGGAPGRDVGVSGASPPLGDSRLLTRLGSPGNGTAACSLLGARGCWSGELGRRSAASAAAGPGERCSGVSVRSFCRGARPRCGHRAVRVPCRAAPGTGPGGMPAGAAVVWKSPPGRDVSAAAFSRGRGSGLCAPSVSVSFLPVARINGKETAFSGAKIKLLW